MQQAALNAEEVFYAALELEGFEARSAFLDRVCGDTELRRRVERLLAVDAKGREFLESPASVATVTATPESRPGVEEPGTVIGPYKLLEPIGEGGMGTVYMAEQTEPVRRRVALKVIKPGMDTKQVVARFEAERQALAMMDHPNIAKVLDGGMTPAGRPYFVMELVRGLPVTEYCDREQLSIPERLELFVLVCRAVQHAHQKGIIHRDLKPSNVLVTVVDGVAVPRVIDFGVAKATGASLTDKTLFTGFHQFVGTPLYTSPEQADLAGSDVDTRSDIYSLGVLLYELLTGTTPFDSETLRRAAFDEMRRIIREEEPQRPSTRLSSLGEKLSTVSARRKVDPKRLGSAVRSELDWVVMKALEKDRRRRYETASDFAADVMRYLADRLVEAHPPSTWYRFGKFARRNRVALSFGVAAGTALVLGIVGLTAALVTISREQARTTAAYRAEARQRQSARRAVDEMYTQVAEKWLGDQPNLTPLQIEFLGKALAFYQGFAAEASSDPEAIFEAAMASIRVGKIQVTLGRNAEAEAALRRATGELAVLAAGHPTRRDYRKGHALARGGLAEVLTGTGRYEAALRVLESVLEEWRKLSAEDPAHPEYRDRLVQIHTSIGVIQDRLYRFQEEEASLRTARGLTEALVVDHPEVDEYRFSLASQQCQLGRMNNRLGRFAEAEVAYRSGLDLLTALVKNHALDPSRRGYREELPHLMQGLARVLINMKRYREAEEMLRRTFALLKALKDDFPEILRYQAAQAEALRSLATAVADGGSVATRAREAEEVFQEAIAIYNDLIRRYPEVPDYRNGLNTTLSERFELRREGGDHAGAARAAEDYIQAVLNDPNPPWLIYLAQRTVPRWAEDCITLAQRDQTLAPAQCEMVIRSYTERAKEQIRELARRGADEPQVLYRVADSLSTAPVTELRDPEFALECAQRCLELRPHDGISWQSLGWARYRVGDWKGCIEAIENENRNKTRDDGDPFLAMAYWQLGDRAQARAVFDRFEKFLPEYIEKCKRQQQKGDHLHPDAVMTRRARDEAAVLLGVQPAQGDAKVKPDSGATPPPD